MKHPTHNTHHCPFRYTSSNFEPSRLDPGHSPGQTLSLSLLSQRRRKITRRVACLLTYALQPTSGPGGRIKCWQHLKTPEVPKKRPPLRKSPGRRRPERLATWPGEEAKSAIRASAPRGLPSPNCASLGLDGLIESSSSPGDQGPDLESLDFSSDHLSSSGKSVRPRHVFFSGAPPAATLLERCGHPSSHQCLARSTEQTLLAGLISTGKKSRSGSKGWWRVRRSQRCSSTLLCCYFLPADRRAGSSVMSFTARKGHNKFLSNSNSNFLSADWFSNTLYTLLDALKDAELETYAK